MASPTQGFPSQLSSAPEALRRYVWPGGAFTTASRSRTALVEGEICSTNHLVMTTLSGGARAHLVRNDDGCRYDGADRPGSASFLPAGLRRRLVLRDVEWRWAALAIEPQTHLGACLVPVRSFVVPSDPFVTAMLSEFDRISLLDGDLDPLWCEQMIGALCAYLGRGRHGETAACRPDLRLPAAKLRRLFDYIDAQLSGPIRTSHLAALCGLSEGHFHRSFRATTGTTPLGYVTARRIECACRLLATTGHSVDVIAYKVGFVSPSHFARLFRQQIGAAPASYRRTRGVGVPSPDRSRA